MQVMRPPHQMTQRHPQSFSKLPFTVVSSEPWNCVANSWRVETRPQIGALPKTRSKRSKSTKLIGSEPKVE